MKNIHSFFQGKTMNAGTLADGPMTVTINELRKVEFKDGDKPVLYFDETDQGLSLIKTNALVLENLFGPDYSTWVGQRIELYLGDTTFEGKPTKGIRVRGEGGGGSGTPF